MSDTEFTEEELDFISEFKGYAKREPVKKKNSLLKRPLLYGSVFSVLMIAVDVILVVFYMNIDRAVQSFDKLGGGVTESALGDSYGTVLSLYESKEFVVGGVAFAAVAVFALFALWDFILQRKRRKKLSAELAID